jgi:small subunit ribosomal protein S19e
MAEPAASTALTVKDVSPHDFVKAYSAHLKRSGKVPRFPRIIHYTEETSLWSIMK